MRLIFLLTLLVFGKYASANNPDSLETPTIWQPTSLEGEHQSLLDRAERLQQTGDVNGALAQYQLLITRLIPEFNNMDPLVNPEEGSLLYAPPILIKALESKAILFEQQAKPKSKITKQLEQALSCRELIVDALFNLRQSYSGAKLLYDAQVAERIQEWKAIDLAFTLFEKTNNPSFLLRCFRLVEKSKKALLPEALVNPKTYQLANVPSDRIMQLAIQKKKISTLRIEWAKELEGTNQELTNTETKAEQAYLAERKAYNNVLNVFKKQYPHVYQLRYSESVVTVGEIQNRLSSTEEVLLSYYSTDNYLYAFVITLNGVRAQKIERPAQLNQWILSFHSMLKNKQEGKEKGNCNAYDDLALQLYQTLIKPFEPLPSNVVIIPDDLIGYVPFNALIYEAPATSCNFATYPFLMDKYRVSTHYSAEAFAKDAFAKKKSRRGDFTAFTSSDQLYAKKVTRQMRGRRIESEAINVDDLEEAMSSSAILMLSNPMTSYAGNHRYKSPLLWSQENEGPQIFYSIKTEAPLVVLSESEIENLEEAKGDFIPGLARGFLHTGVKSVLTTLWPLPEGADEIQLPTYFKLLKKGKTKSAALQKSSQGYRTKVATSAAAAPSNWAAYMLIGNTDPITERNWYWLLLTLIPLSWLWVQWRKRQRAKAKKANEVTTTMEY